MSKIKIALCQMNVVDNKQENILKATSMIEEVASYDSNFVVLPEMFNCPYSNDKFIEYAEEEKTSPTIKSISKLAKKHKIYILAGSIPEKEESRIFNTSYLFDKTGNIIGKHRKMHLFDVDVKDGIYFKESDTLTPGNEFNVCECDFGTIGLGICYDIRFPQFAQINVKNGAQILVYPGAFNMTTGPAHWELLFRSRALDNQVFCIGVAPALNENASYHSYGHSIVVNPWGEVICQLKQNEELKIVEIDLNEIKKVRQEIPVLKNKRNDLYEIIEK